MFKCIFGGLDLHLVPLIKMLNCIKYDMKCNNSVVIKGKGNRNNTEKNTSFKCKHQNMIYNCHISFQYSSLSLIGSFYLERGGAGQHRPYRK